MRMRGEITVFLSLIVVCVLSLIMGLLESARTAGARLYLRMAADSAITSVMSQYNQNLWDMYQLLFLEYESEKAIENSFEAYLDFYLEQENFYPMKKKSVELTELVAIGDNGADALEQEILSYVKYRLPEMAADLAGLSKEAGEAAKAGDFGSLFEACRQAGRRTGRLEKQRRKVEASIEEMREFKEKLVAAVENENDRTFQTNAKKLKREMQDFSKAVNAYEKEFLEISSHREGLLKEENLEDGTAAKAMDQELTAYEQVEAGAKQELELYREKEILVKDSLEILQTAMDFYEESQEMDAEEDENEEIVWETLQEYMDDLELPEGEKKREVDEEKAAALERLEDFLEKDLLEYLVPEGTEISDKQVSLKNAPSVNLQKGEKTDKKTAQGILEQFLVNEYIGLYFDSFTEKHGGDALPENRVLTYEQEYLLCGKAKDRDNLEGAVEAVLTIRGAMNLLYLLNSAEKRAQADSLAASVSAGNIPLQVLLSFFILTLWAFGEAILDARILLAGGTVALWKDESSWRMGLEGLLSLDFLSGDTEVEGKSGRDYEDYLQILLFLMNSTSRNFRMMDVMQWNIRKKQADFSIESCAYEIEMQAEVSERHLFLVREEYVGRVTVASSY